MESLTHCRQHTAARLWLFMSVSCCLPSSAVSGLRPYLFVTQQPVCADSIPGQGACQFRSGKCIVDGKYVSKVGALADFLNAILDMDLCTSFDNFDGSCNDFGATLVAKPLMCEWTHVAEPQHSATVCGDCSMSHMFLSSGKCLIACHCFTRT